ncbi:M14-type cytosolic carboxypeptidase [Tropicimonas sp. IMCC34011]|uniref:M14 family metallopeptidase n=1 Tax=Tropicimonas sp. IMCC34011 TaxID=2248759 RepID=UPI000E266ADA|nr:M14-type cytosolic carboxypeptidase [Tropicimonas sp. IMCC34011]
MTIAISSMIPSGRIDVLDATDPAAIRLRVPGDPGSDFVGWYNFRVSGAKDVRCRFTIEGCRAAEAGRLTGREGYEDQWTNTGPLVSTDGHTWRRVPAEYDGETFSFELTPERDVIQIAKFAPFGPERDAALIARALTDPGVRLEEIGRSVQGRPIDRLTFDADAEKPVLWLVARQHPSETQGGFLLEGLLERLLDPADAGARVLRESAEINIVPNANPDGSALGHTRTNAAGANLNREWETPDPERAPEVVAIRSVMEARGLDFFLDCHADQELHCNFIWPSENVPGWRPERRAPFEAFEAAWAAASPDYEPGHPYPGGCPESPDLGMAWNWVGSAFPHALSVLLEQPFKDVSAHPVPETGWCPARAHAFGRSLVGPLLAVLPHLERTR